MQAPSQCFLKKLQPVPLDAARCTRLCDAERACFSDIVFACARRLSTSVFSSESQSTDVPFYFLFTRGVRVKSFAIWSLWLVEKPANEVLQSCEVLRTAKLLSEVVERLSRGIIQAKRIRLTFVWFLKSHVWTFSLTWTRIRVRCSLCVFKRKAVHLLAI